MNAREQGFLLLSSHLGDPDRHPLTAAQLRILATRVENAPRDSGQRDLEPRDLTAMGYGREMAGHICRLLSEEALLEQYLRRGRHQACHPLTRVSAEYPAVVRKRMGLDSPGVLWCKGDRTLLTAAKIALVGSRELREPNREFARAVGRAAAEQGYVLVSGNAAGADREAQNACLEAGGSVISVVATELGTLPVQDRVLYLAEEGYDLPFTAPRALSRNRVIHSLGEKSLVAQATLEKGGSWDGSVQNLRFRYSPLFVFADGSDAAARLADLGATPVMLPELWDLSALQQLHTDFFDQ